MEQVDEQLDNDNLVSRSEQIERVGQIFKDQRQLSPQSNDQE